MDAQIKTGDDWVELDMQGRDMAVDRDLACQASPDMQAQFMALNA